MGVGIDKEECFFFFAWFAKDKIPSKLVQLKGVLLERSRVLLRNPRIGRIPVLL